MGGGHSSIISLVERSVCSSYAPPPSVLIWLAWPYMEDESCGVSRLSQSDDS